MSKPTPELLEEIASEHDQSRGFTPRLIQCRARVLNEMIPAGRVLDLGCADGLLTEHLARHHERVVAVDASETRAQRTRERTDGLPVEVRVSFFESFQPGQNERFDAVVLSCILEHLDDPVALLRRCASWLTDTGVVAAIVPHGRSLHRRAGVHMGMLEDIMALGEADDALDHKRVYTLDSLRGEFTEAGLTPVQAGGILLKPVPNKELARLPAALVDAYEKLGRELPELAAEIFAIGTVA